jgi:alkylation response protein AidB-like acyl-CoA dehydrogenase
MTTITTMRLEPTGADAAIVEEAVAWLLDWLPDDYDERFADYRQDLAFRSAYQRAAYEAGWLVPVWPRALGGHEVGEEADLWIKLRFARHGAPKLPNVQGPGVIAPALMSFGDEAQRALLQPVLRGDVWWCLGMSEPQAGSDLASLRATAKETEDGFVLNGQKVWTSHANNASHCLVFARTGAQDARHRAISAFVVPMDTPGVTVRKIDKIGPEDEEFCEVFFDDALVPVTALLGERDQGWTVAMTSLSFERDMIWIMNLVEIERAMEVTRQSLRHEPDAALATELARMGADADAIWVTGLRALGNRLAERPDRQLGLLKLVSTEAAQRAFDLASRAAGPRAVLAGDEAPYHGERSAGEIEALGATIYGGTSEIQRNIIGEKILGLPR